MRFQARTVTSADGGLLRGTADLLVAAVERREAVGLAAPLTPDEYLRHLDGLLADAARGDAGLVVVTDENGRPAGTAQWRRSPYGTRRVLAEVDRVSIAVEARGQGLGRLLMERIVADAAAHEVEVLMLEVRGNNHGAIALYEKCGFQRNGLLPGAVADGDARHDVILMTRELPRPRGLRLLGELPVGAGTSHRDLDGPGWLRTERLLLCRPVPADAEAYFALASDPAAHPYNPGEPLTEPEATTRVADWIEDWQVHGLGYWTVRDPETGETIGFGGVTPSAEDGSLNLWYHFQPSVWGRGYATELGRKALALAGGRPVVALIRPQNTPSIKVVERLGLRRDGEVERELGLYLRYTHSR
jgi:RimJ/RimL family protein N-acetyltransferase